MMMTALADQVMSQQLEEKLVVGLNNKVEVIADGEISEGGDMVLRCVARRLRDLIIFKSEEPLGWYFGDYDLVLRIHGFEYRDHYAIFSLMISNYPEKPPLEVVWGESFYSAGNDTEGRDYLCERIADQLDKSTAGQEGSVRDARKAKIDAVKGQDPRQ